MPLPGRSWLWARDSRTGSAPFYADGEGVDLARLFDARRYSAPSASHHVDWVGITVDGSILRLTSASKDA